MKSVFDAWVRQGIAAETGATEAMLDAIESAHGIVLPRSFRALWMLADGTMASDLHGLIFMQASDLIQPLYATRNGAEVDLMFADWRLGTAMVLHLSPTDKGVTAVDNKRQPISPSFEAFVESYASGDPFA